jgi:hypothetical protein
MSSPNNPSENPEENVFAIDEATGEALRDLELPIQDPFEKLASLKPVDREIVTPEDQKRLEEIMDGTHSIKGVSIWRRFIGLFRR